MNGNPGSDENPGGIQGVCPDGWHVPSDSEWKELEMFLGMIEAAADSVGLRGASWLLLPPSGWTDIYSKYSSIHRYKSLKSTGFSVQCMKDR